MTGDDDVALPNPSERFDELLTRLSMWVGLWRSTLIMPLILCFLSLLPIMLNYARIML